MPDPIHELAVDPDATARRLAHAAPTVSVASAVGGEVRTGGAADAVLRPGSVTKLLTAVLAHEHLGLDDPVEGFDGVRVRHLVSHTSGLDAGDLFVDTGPGDDALERYVDGLRGVRRLFEPGRAFSYCNAGFVLAGHLVERARGTSWDDEVRRLLPGAEIRPEPELGPVTTRALGPAGGTLACRAADLAAFARDHLATPGTEVLRELQAWAPGGVAEMRGPGMGWMLWRNAAQDSVRIAGAYPGHSAVIAADPVTRDVVVVMTDHEAAVNAVTALLDAPGPPPPDLDRYTGDYESHAYRLTVGVDDDHLVLRWGEATAPLGASADGVTFLSPMGPVAFFEPDHLGRPWHLRWRMRVATRVGH